MTYAALQTAFFRRGFEEWSDAGAGLTETKRFLNEAYLTDICEAHLWPFCETTASGTAPVTINDLRTVIYVQDTTNDHGLLAADVRDLRDRDPDFTTTTGAPEFYWLDGTSTLKVYPVSTAPSLTVRYVKVPAELSADGDTPVVPTRYHELIVDGAVRRAYNAKNNFEAAAAIQTEIDRGMQRMVENLLARSADNLRLVSAEAV